jgi:hypothetical protein
MTARAETGRDGWWRRVQFSALGSLMAILSVALQHVGSAEAAGTCTAHIRGCRAGRRSLMSAFLLVAGTRWCDNQGVSPCQPRKPALEHQQQHWLEEGGASALYMFQIAFSHTLGHTISVLSN